MHEILAGKIVTLRHCGVLFLMVRYRQSPEHSSPAHILRKILAYRRIFQRFKTEPPHGEW